MCERRERGLDGEKERRMVSQCDERKRIMRKVRKWRQMGGVGVDEHKMDDRGRIDSTLEEHD